MGTKHLRRAGIIIVVAWVVYFLRSEPTVVNEGILVLPPPAEKAEVTAPKQPRREPAPLRKRVLPAQVEGTSSFLEQLERSVKHHRLEDTFSLAQNHFVVVALDDEWVMQGDILVDEKLLIPQVEGEEVRIAKVAEVSYWPEGLVPYALDSGVAGDKIFAAMREIMSKTAVRFVEVGHEKDFVLFQGTSHESMSYLGRRGGEQKILINPDSPTGTIVHELMHALGFVHEHSRADRDSYVTVMWEHILDPHKAQFQKMPPEISLPVRTAFDFDSILLYSSDAFAKDEKSPAVVKKDGSVFAVQREGLSALDIAKIKGLYPVRER
jgi:hypothetical protein